jgi:S-DNA-T family DNA segregation ATPase FtsK/SpoIIIE
VIVGKTDGLLPSRHKGRGLVAMDRVYEFQTAYCTNEADHYEFLSAFCERLTAKAKFFAQCIPVLPDIVKINDVESCLTDLQSVPVGIGKRSLTPVCVNIANKVALPVISQELSQTVCFLEEWLQVLNSVTELLCVDAEQVLSAEKLQGVEVYSGAVETLVHRIFNETVERNNVYKDAKLDLSVLEPYARKTFVLVGFKRFYDQLTADGKEKISLVLQKAEAIYKLHFILVECAAELNGFNYEAWYKRCITGAEGIWVGDGIADQYLLKLNKITSDLYEELGDEYGYVLTRNRPTLVKLLSSATEEDE